MDWNSAVSAMLSGETLRRRSETFSREIASGVYETGEEGAVVLRAWTIDNIPVCVFVGASSRAPFIPTDVHINALDWEVQREWSTACSEIDWG